LDVALLSALKRSGFEIHLETNGSRALRELRDWIDHVTMSPKQKREDTKLESCDDLKLLYPLHDPAVSLEAFDSFPCDRKFLQPVMDQNYEGNLRATVCRIYGNPEWRLSLQIHKIVGVE
jgi:organic radical activating enzyme